MTTTPPFLLSSDASIESLERRLPRAHDRGELVRLRRGVYLPKKSWEVLDRDERYRAEVTASARTVREGTRFSHDSAAVLWRLPSLGPWSAKSHVLGERAGGGRSSRLITRHGIGGDPAGVVIDGVPVTSLLRTLVDSAMTASFLRSVGMIDDALRPPTSGDFRFGVTPPTHAEVVDAMAARAGCRGAVRGAAAVTFASGLSGSLGESLSRGQFHHLGCEAPELQVAFYDDQGFIGFVDFWWPRLRLIGEFDGRVKYRGESYLRGRLPEEVVCPKRSSGPRSFARIGFGASPTDLFAGIGLPRGIVRRLPDVLHRSDYCPAASAPVVTDAGLSDIRCPSTERDSPMVQRTLAQPVAGRPT